MSPYARAGTQELARQVSVTCIERGTVLARLWSYVHARKDGVDLKLGPSEPRVCPAACVTALPRICPTFHGLLAQGCGADFGGRVSHFRGRQAGGTGGAVRGTGTVNSGLCTRILVGPLKHY